MHYFSQYPITIDLNSKQMNFFFICETERWTISFLGAKRNQFRWSNFYIEKQRTLKKINFCSNFGQFLFFRYASALNKINYKIEINKINYRKKKQVVRFNRQIQFKQTFV